MELKDSSCYRETEHYGTSIIYVFSTEYKVIQSIDYLAARLLHDHLHHNTIIIHSQGSNS